MVREGRRRNPTDWSYNLTSQPALFADRGFTGHEYLAEFDLYNMNGRLYDPVVGRFLSVDNFVQMPDYTQNFNRYSYALNNPLRFTDQSGEIIFTIIGALLAPVTGGASLAIGIAMDVGGAINLGVKAYQGKINSLGDGLVAYGIGAAAGAIGYATGGAAFAAMGGVAGGAGGFLAGFAGGAIGSVYAMPVQSIGNSLYFGDPMMTPEQYALGILGGGVLGGTIQGISALANGRTFWNGDIRGTGIPTPGPTPTLKFDEAEVKLNTDGMRSPLKPMPDMPDNPTFWRVNGSDGQTRWINQQDLTLSPRQSLHLGNTAGRSPLTIDPSRVLGDLNKGNYQFIQLNARNSMPIVRFNYDIGNVVSQSGQSMGVTSFGTVHINSMGQVHIVPWMPR